MDPDSPQLDRQAVLSTPQIPFPQRLRELSRASGSVSRYMFATGILQILRSSSWSAFLQASLPFSSGVV
jgi:hypothetical protein